MHNKKIAVVGATGMVGKAFFDVLAEKDIPYQNLYAVASERSTGKFISYKNHPLEIHNLENFSFQNIDIALFSPGSDISKIYAPKAASEGCVVIDNTSAFRMNDDIPLIVPEINGHTLKNFHGGIIANPNCSTIQMLMCLQPIHNLYNIQKVIVSTYQSVSGAGQAAIQTLCAESENILQHKENHVQTSPFSKQIAFNLIPKIDAWADLDYTKEEWKMINETKKILNPSIQVVPTCVRVPVTIGHSLSIHVQCQNKIDLLKIRNTIKQSEGLVLKDASSKDDFITPVECVHSNNVFISRLRHDPFCEKSLSFWSVADNIRKGAATNAIQIAELL